MGRVGSGGQSLQSRGARALVMQAKAAAAEAPVRRTTIAEKGARPPSKDSGDRVERETSARVHENAQKKALDDAVAKAAALQRANEKLAEELKKAKSGSGAPTPQPKQKLSNGGRRNKKVIAEWQITFLVATPPLMQYCAVPGGDQGEPAGYAVLSAEQADLHAQVIAPLRLVADLASRVALGCIFVSRSDVSHRSDHGSPRKDRRYRDSRGV